MEVPSRRPRLGLRARRSSGDYGIDVADPADDHAEVNHAAGIAIPAGRSPEGLPVGVQLIGPSFEDRTPLRLAELLDQKTRGFQAPK